MPAKSLPPPPLRNLAIILASVVCSSLLIGSAMPSPRRDDRERWKSSADFYVRHEDFDDDVLPIVDANGHFDERALRLHMHDRRIALVNESSVVRYEEIRRHFEAEMEMTRSKGWLLSKAKKDEREEYLELFTDPERGDLLFGDMCGTVAAFAMTGGVKVHLYMGGEEWDSNWGSFSTHVPGRTEDWGSWEVHWTEDGCELDDIWHYLNHTNLSAIFTTQHQWLDHPKVFSVPLGQQANAAKALRTMPISDRENLLLINVRGTPTRTPIVERVVSNFDGAIRNGYVEGWEDDSPDESDYLRQLTNSKFVLCPSGMGWDTYRVWEALILGAIPILEKYGRRDGLYSSYDDLPVLWVGLYDEVTPSLLEGEYPRILSKAVQYKFEKLTNQWWIDLINSYRVK